MPLVAQAARDLDAIDVHLHGNQHLSDPGVQEPEAR
jgi:hypothetical protein